MTGELLDNYWNALIEAGYQRSVTQPGPTEKSIRDMLAAAGYGAPSDLVEFFQWAQYLDERPLWLFEYHATPYSPTRAVSGGRWARDFWSGASPAGLLCMLDERHRQDFALPHNPDWKSWLPIAMGVDSSDQILIDTSDDPSHAGSIWCQEKHGVFRAFDSLDDAIRAATYCVDAGIWEISDNGLSIRCPGRRSAPSLYDLETPPYHGYVHASDDQQ